MKKKVVITIIAVVLVLIVGVIGFILLNNNKIVSTITLDINPSIEINLDKNEKVILIIALNDDANDIINDNLKGKTIEETLNVIIDNLIEKGYANENDLLEVILYTDGKISNKEFEKKLTKTFSEKRIDSDIIVVEKVTKEDEELAKKYNVSPAKVSYIKSIEEENENVNIEDLVDKSVNELEETKRTGNYCDSGYNLEGDWCLKEINRISAKEGQVCPNGYVEYKGTCYLEGAFKGTGKYQCNSYGELIDNECVDKKTYDAKVEYSCSKGELMKKSAVNPIGAPDNDTYYCIDKSTGQKPVLKCLKSSGHIMVNGQCYNGPKPTVNGGCLNGDLLSNGKCYSKDNGEDYQCPDGHIYDKNLELCPDTLTYIKPTISGYSCDNDGSVLDGTKCTITSSYPAEEIYACVEGFTFVNETCLNYNKTVSKQDGFYCEGENTRLVGNKCIIYEKVEAKHN